MKQAEARVIVKRHVLWSMGAGLLPIPLADMAAVTAIQIDLIQQLSALYGIDFSTSTGKTFVGALTGSTVAKIGASMLKAIPGVGTLIGGLSMSVMSGASTYAVGEVAINHFERDGNLHNVDLGWARSAYQSKFEEGKKVVKDMKEHEDESRDVFASLEKLGALRDKGIVTEEEFQAKKAELLAKLA